MVGGGGNTSTSSCCIPGGGGHERKPAKFGRNYMAKIVISATLDAIKLGRAQIRPFSGRIRASATLKSGTRRTIATDISA